MKEPQVRVVRYQVIYTRQADQTAAVEHYWQSAALRCSSAESFIRTIEHRATQSGLTLQHIETPLTKGQWQAQHSEEPKSETDAEIERLIDKAEQYHNIATGYLYAIPKEKEKPQTEPYLHIETLDNIEPLDGQFDVHPAKTVPDKLYEPLFGQPEPTEQEIEQYGKKEAIPPMKLYAILDAAKIKTPGLRNLLDTSGLDFACLITGEDYEALKDSAPYIVELKEGNDFTRTLFTYNPKFSDKHLSVHLWHKEPGIYIRSRANLIELGQHFAQFVRVQDESGKRYFFRFYDPKVMRELLRYLRHKPDYLQHWFTLSKAIKCYDATSGNFFQFYPDASFYQQNQTMPSIVADKVYQDIFAEIILDRDAKKIAAAIQHDFGSKCVLSDDDLKTMVKKSIQQGRELGLHSELALGQYAAASCLFGQPIQKEQLQMMPDFFDETVHENKRTKQLLNAVLNQLQSTKQ